MMKLIGATLLILAIFAKTNAQIVHCIGINQIAYGNTFSSQPDDLFGKVSSQKFSPTISYRVERKNQSLEAYFSYFHKTYAYKLNAINEYQYAGFGLNYGYRFLEKDNFSIRGIGGVNYTHNQQNNYFDFCGWSGISEWNLGIQLGLNANFTFWKGAFINSSVRYNNYPSQKYLSNQSLALELGLGYAFNRRKNI